MNREETSEMLRKEYSVTLSGATIGYLIQLLADAQFRLNEEADANPDNPMAALLSTANDTVGNEVLHAVYAASGTDLLSFVMKTGKDALDKLMTAETPEEVEEAGIALGGDPDDAKESIEKIRRAREKAKAAIKIKLH